LENGTQYARGRPPSGRKNTENTLWAFAANTPTAPHPQVKPIICVISGQNSGRNQLASHMILSKFIWTRVKFTV
jgi:hypothetical protein